MNREPIFILGTHKSGTSLLRNLFDGHSELFVVPIESHLMQYMGYWVDYGIRRSYPQKLTKKQIIDNYIQWIEHSNNSFNKSADSDTRGFWDVNEFKNSFYNSPYEEKSNKDLINGYFYAMYRSLYKKEPPHNIRIVEKSVENIEFAIELKKYYPNAKFIHILRNPYSNLVSIRKFKSKKNYPFLKPIIESMYNSYYHLEKNSRVFKDDYMVIRYEDLVTMPNETIDKVIGFTNLRKEEILYRPTVSSEIWKGNSTTGQEFKGVSTNAIKGWKKDIFPLEINIINKYFHYTIEKYGYEFIENGNALSPSKNENLKVYTANRLLYKYYV